MILVLNCGSQSIKWKVFNHELKPIKEGKCFVLEQNLFQKSLESELRKTAGFKINLIGHRVVHGGGVFVKPIKITDIILSELERLNYLAPLHNPFNILGIKACQKNFKGPRGCPKQFAVFDTEFFADLPEKSSLYALPENISRELSLRRYGFHGISHQFVAQKASETLKKPLEALKIITCHLGGGASISAIKNGKAIDTSMGFTPMDGLVMMTRPGSIDPGIILEIVKKVSLKTADEILNKQSGIKGICGQGDMLRVLDKIKSGDKKAKLALEVFIYSIQKYIGAYFAILGGCDALVFTGTIGSGTSGNRGPSKKIRNMICKDMKILNKTKILVVEDNEELAIAQKIFNFQ